MGKSDSNGLNYYQKKVIKVADKGGLDYLTDIIKEYIKHTKQDLIVTIETSIQEETNRATEAEQNLQEQIDALETSSEVDISELTRRIAAEENRAQTAETVIEGDINMLEINKANLADLATVATTGDYDDLIDTPVPATKTTDGLMSNTDKIKLDDIELDVDFTCEEISNLINF